MIFAAGLGTRLGALGEETPKALIEIAGRTMLERVAERLVSAGARRVIVNAHHHAERIERFVASHDFGVEVTVSREDERPLETGGGLLHARALFRGDDVILLHNVDVLGSASLAPLVEAQQASDALASLVVAERDTARRLLFDDAGLLGREDRRDGSRRAVRPSVGPVRSLAFQGVHAIAPALPDLITERGVFPIVDVYLRLAAAGHRIAPCILAGDDWLEIGSLERLEAVRARIERTRDA